MTREIWTDEDELGYQIGDMNGEWEREEFKKKPTGPKIEKPFTRTPTKPVRIDRRPEIMKKHIRRDGRR